MAGSRRGFTLIEMMAVIVMLGIVSTLVAVNVLDHLEHAKARTTKIKLRALEGSLEIFRMDQRHYPSTGDGLGALVSRPVGSERYYPERGYVRDEEAIADGWQRPFQYQEPGRRSRAGYDLWSQGRDGREGGAGLDADIANWKGAR